MPMNNCVAMILAGGQGSRLRALTRNLAKPAVPFGGKYRIIDFSLSNCTYSGIRTVGVLTQYRPLELNAHIGDGAPWDLDFRFGGLRLLPPFVGTEGGQWYQGTANAVYQNLNFIDAYDPEHVLVLSGDHIYKMNYSLMIKEHILNKADVTIAAITVPWEEACRFGTMATDENGQITGFEEKSSEPRSNMASMGIYVFNTQFLMDHLAADEKEPGSTHDFGRDVIPRMLKSGGRMFAYNFQGYWRDVGTITSYWEANMDLLSAVPQLDLFDSSWKILSRDFSLPAQFIAPGARINNSLVSEGCHVAGIVENSILFTGVFIGKGSRVINSIVLPNTLIRKNVIVQNALIGEDAVIHEGLTVGEESNVLPSVVIEEGSWIFPEIFQGEVLR